MAELALSNDQTLDRLATLSSLIGDSETALAALYAERLGLYRHGQASTPKLTLARMAAAAGVTEVAVSVAISKARAKEAPDAGQA